MTTTRPELVGSGFRGGYRLYTVEHADYDAAVALGGSMVATPTCAVSYSQLDRVLSSAIVVAEDDGLVTLSLRIYSASNDAWVEHPLSGTKYATRDDAKRAAYGVGALAAMVYEQ